MSATTAITADQTAAILALDKLNLLDATIAARILGDAAPTIAPPKAVPAKREPKAEPKAEKRDWRTGPATKGQHRRIPAAEEAIIASGRKRGAKLILRGDERTAAFATAGSASDYYKTLATFTRKHGIDF